MCREEELERKAIISISISISIGIGIGISISIVICIYFLFCFPKYCGACCGKNLAICLTDISEVETVLKIKCQVVLCRKLIKRRK